jgi:hypothetical protein
MNGKGPQTSGKGKEVDKFYLKVVAFNLQPQMALW